MTTENKKIAQVLEDIEERGKSWQETKKGKLSEDGRN
jgi:hypothetical protein